MHRNVIGYPPWRCAACGESEVKRETCLFWFSCAGPDTLFELETDYRKVRVNEEVA